ncbi:MAG: galactokinase [Candidatus Omnitrophota bacterium]|jgi:galactokinase
MMPMFRVRAPGRINLIGEHVDYQDGWVMPMAIDRYITAEITPRADPVIEVDSDRNTLGPILGTPDDALPREGDQDWANYVFGVIAVYREAGIACPGFSMQISADLPDGAGLSSSAAMETLTALTVEHLSGKTLAPVRRAKLCQRAEHTWAKVPCGIMDQLAVGASESGAALLIDCRDCSLESVPFPDGVSVVVADTRVKHALGDGPYKERRGACEATARLFGVSTLRDVTLEQVHAAADELGELYPRARHVVSEIARVPAFATALRNGAFEEVGQLMLASHVSLRDDFEVSCKELDALVDAAYAFGPEQGLIGSRMTGGGFGGSTVSLVHTAAAPALMRHLEQVRFKDLPRSAHIFSVQAAAGAHILP